MNFAAALLENAPDAILVLGEDGTVEIANPRAEQLFGGLVVGRRLDDLIAAAPLVLDVSRGRLGARVIAIVHEHSALESECRDLELHPDPLLEALLEPVGVALGAPLVAVSIRGTDDGTIRVRAARGLPSNVIGHEIRLGEGISGRIAARGPRTYDQPRALVDVRWRDFVPGRMIGVPLVAGDQTIGAVVAGRDAAFTPEQTALLDRFAERLSHAFERGRRLRSPA